jgi:membrane fusion protein, adhesin transport system
MSQKNEDYDYLPPTVKAFLGKSSRVSFWMLYTTLALFTVFLMWAAFSEVEEVTVGIGKVVPSKHVQVIDNLEGGILKEILVSEGQIVKKDQILLRLENVAAKEKYRENQENYIRFLAMKERLNAQIEGKIYVPSPEVLSKNSVLATEQARYFNTQTEKLNSEMEIAFQEVEQRKQDLENQKAQLRKFQAQYEITEKQVAIKEPLAKKQLVSQIDYLNLKRELEEQKGQMNSLRTFIPKAESEHKQAEKVAKQIQFKFRDEHLAELKDVEQKFQDVKSALETDKDRVTRTDIRSPVYGIVKLIKSKTIGGAIEPGADLIEVVPLDDYLLIEANVLPADVAFLRPGLDAMVKVTAYDYSVYGGLKAKLINVSADAIVDEKGQSFFKIQLRTGKNYLQKEGRKMPIISGMQVTTHVFTGKKTILNYLLKPFVKAKYDALRER